MPEIDIAWPIWPSVTPRFVAIGDSRLTGMNSEAIRTATQSAKEKTAPQAAVTGREAWSLPEVTLVSISSVSGCWVMRAIYSPPTSPISRCN